jgi:arginyl-tRNA synthetase
MFLSLQDTLRARLRALIADHFHLDVGDFAIERPPNVKFGDFAVPVAFELAKRLKAETGEKRNPRQLAETLRAALSTPPGVARVEVAGAGYLNFFLERDRFLLAGLAPDADAPAAPAIGGKLIVEHTSVNPNKAAHIGHLRNAVLGDTLVRLLRARGETVEVQNYIDNTGVQVADVAVGFLHLEGKSLADIAAIEGKFDDYCWDLYARVGKWYDEDRTRLHLRAAVLHAVEANEGEAAAVAQHVALRVLKCHLDTMWRLGVRYDVLPCESEILHLHFWDRAFERLRDGGAIVYETEGRNKGCWVMRSDSAADETEESEHDADKILVRSNGTVNYTGKDIAYHLWKLGQLGLNFRYKFFHAYPDGHAVWISTSDQDATDTRPIKEFGNGDAYFNVIDAGQSYAQEFVKKGVLSVVAPDASARVARSAHLSYEKVALTPASCDELGFTLSDDDRRRAFVTMSGRKGLGVKADDLIDRLEANALAHVAEHQPQLSGQEQADIAHSIAVGALRYFLLKFTRNTIIAFDFKEAMAEHGETGVYLLYSLVRIRSIYAKLREAGVACDAPTPELAAARARVVEFFSGDVGDEIWALVSLALRYEEHLHDATNALEPATVAKYAFQLAQAFSAFYNRHNIKNESDALRQQFLIAVVKLVERRLGAALDVMGIAAPEKM